MTDPVQPTAVLECRDVFRFRPAEDEQIPILKGVSFRLEKGTFTTIMGPSGSGKSTLLHLLAGLDLPSAGEVLLGGDLILGFETPELCRGPCLADASVRLRRLDSFVVTHLRGDLQIRTVVTCRAGSLERTLYNGTD